MINNTHLRLHEALLIVGAIPETDNTYTSAHLHECFARTSTPKATADIILRLLSSQNRLKQ